MEKMKVGYGRAEITPEGPINLGGYGNDAVRISEEVRDPLYATCIAFTDPNGNTVLLFTTDMLSTYEALANPVREALSQEFGIPFENIMVSATHSHSTPAAGRTDDVMMAFREKYAEGLKEAARKAMADRTEAAIYVGNAYTECMNWVRHYKMADGSTMTCPPIDDPDIVGPIGELDQRVNVLRFDREGRKPFILVNYGVHADTVNGDVLSADWPYWMEKTLDLALEGANCMFICGAQGDVGSTNVHPDSADMNDTEISFDNEMKSPGMARFVGRALAGTVLQLYDKVYYTDVDSIHMITKTVPVRLNVPEPHEVPLAKKYKELHEAGRDCDIPYTAMEQNTVVAEALRICKYENSPEFLDMNMLGLRLGPVALVGIPGEPFTEIGVKIKEAEGFDMILPCALTNGCEGYFPSPEAYAAGGYEARSSHFKPHVSDKIVEGCKELLVELK